MTPRQEVMLGADSATQQGPRGRDALRRYEVARARGMALVLGMLCLAGLAWFPLLGGQPTLLIITMVTTGYLALVCGVVLVRIKRQRNYTLLFRWFAVSCVVGSIVIQSHVGLFSPAPVVVTFGISFFGAAEDRKWGVGCCLVAIAIYALLASLVVANVLPDLGLIRGLTSTAGRLFGMSMVPLAFLGTLRQARLSRRAAEDAMAQVEDAVRVVHQREAQLAEANRDLEQALEAGGGVGRHTGRKAGAWVLGPLIGRGAMGEVYGAVHGTKSDRAAVKTLIASAGQNNLERFWREAAITMRLRSPNLVAVYETGAFDDNVPFLVMELLRGQDLASLLRKLRQLELGTVVTLTDQIAAGLDIAHGAGIIHRDIKPQNLFHHAPDDVWKILDFGVSKERGTQGTLTQNQIVGTPAYMSPEQARGDELDHRSDLFSLGAVIYRAVTGQPPFRGKDTPQIMFDVVYRNPSKPSSLAPELPADIDAFLAIAMAKDPDDRFAAAHELAVALRAATAGTLDLQLRQRARRLHEALAWGAHDREQSAAAVSREEAETALVQEPDRPH